MEAAVCAIFLVSCKNHVKCIPVNVLTKQLRTADKGEFPCLGVRRGADISSPYEVNMMRNAAEGHRVGQSVWNGIRSRQVWSELHTGLVGEG